MDFWKDYKQQLTQQGGGDYCKEGKFNLEWVQRESGKDWFWFFRCFANGRVFKSNYGGIWLGTPGETVNGWGITVYSQRMGVGNFINRRMNGHGTLTYNTGVKYEGEWCRDYLHGLGSITYPDGIQYQGQWNRNELGSVDCFIVTNEYRI